MTIYYCDFCGRAHSQHNPVQTDAVSINRSFTRSADVCVECTKRIEDIIKSREWAPVKEQV